MTEEFNVVGKRVPGIDALGKALGDIRYVSDIYLPGMLAGKVLRSPLPHARILHIDTSEAARLRGVKAVITAADTTRGKFCFNPNARKDNMILQEEKVRYVGDQVAAVAAVDKDTAQEALTLIKVDYEPLAGVFDPEEAMQPGASEIHDGGNIALHGVRVFGNIEEGFREADFICEGTYFTSRQAHCCMEPRGCVAQYDLSGHLSLWSHTQTPHSLRQEMSEVLEIPQSKISIFQAPIGGAFGAKIGMDPIDAIAAILSMNTGRPVKIVNTREEEFLSSRTRYPMKIWIKSGAKKNGRLTARDVKIIGDNGAYNHHGQFVIGNAGGKTAQLYAVPNIRVELFLVYTNNVYGGAYRGYGNPQITYAMETQLDEIAEAINMDPAEIRLVNANKPNSKTVSGCSIESCGFKECINTAVKASHWKEKKGKRVRQSQRRRGIGMACMIHGGSGVKFFYGKGCNTSSAILKVNTDGSVDILSGSAEMGQGCNTALAIIAAEELGIAVSDINVIYGDTDVTPPCGGAFGSRQTFIDGNAVRYAASDAKKQLLSAASNLMGAPSKDLAINSGKISMIGEPTKYVTVADAAAESWVNRGIPVIAQGIEDDPHSIQPDPKTGIGNVSTAFIFAAQVAEVEVDTETGQVEVIEFWCAHDVGRVINRFGAKGQIEGGLLSQGIGYGLMEDLIVKEGEVLNTNFADYKMPTIRDICKTNIYFIETDDKYGPFGAKGIGEPPMIPSAPAIANAIYDAIGVRINDLPITPEKILAALREKNRRN